MTNDKVKKRKVLMSKQACFTRNVNSVVLLFFLIVLLGLIAVDNDFMSGRGILLSAAVPSWIIFIWFSCRRTKTSCHHSSIYKGSLEDLIKEMYIHGFSLKEKVGEFYVLETSYFLLKTTILVKTDGKNCELFGGYPNELSNKGE
jgi:hypothetical protein